MVAPVVAPGKTGQVRKGRPGRLVRHTAARVPRRYRIRPNRYPRPRQQTRPGLSRRLRAGDNPGRR
jgi:hypothetical protein